MRILSILLFSPPSELCGGAERQMHSVHKGLISKGIDVQVLADISNVGVSYQVFEGVPIWGVPFPILARSLLRPSIIQSWLRFMKILRLIKIDIGHIDLIQVTPIREAACGVFGFQDTSISLGLEDLPVAVPMGILATWVGICHGTD